MLSKPIVTILGASAPTTIKLFHAMPERLRSSTAWRLYGRNQRMLEALKKCMQEDLQCTDVAALTSLSDALDGSDVVIGQVRCGGLNGRQLDEDLSAMSGTVVDETMGSSGLQAAVRQYPWHHAVGKMIAEKCPKAIVLNLANPLGATCRALLEAGVSQVYGLCELPLRTALTSQGMDEYQSDVDLNWNYAGVNHRGFVCDLSVSGTTPAPSGPWDAGVFETSYYNTAIGAGQLSAGRAASVMKIRDRQVDLLLQGEPKEGSAELDERETPWYDFALSPALDAVLGGPEYDSTINLYCEVAGLVLEQRGCLSSEGWVASPKPTLHSQVRSLVDIWTAQEVAVQNAAINPTKENLHKSLLLTPNLKPWAIEEVINRITEQRAFGDSIAAGANA